MKRQNDLCLKVHFKPWLDIVDEPLFFEPEDFLGLGLGFGTSSSSDNRPAKGSSSSNSERFQSQLIQTCNSKQSSGVLL